VPIGGGRPVTSGRSSIDDLGVGDRGRRREGPVTRVRRRHAVGADRQERTGTGGRTAGGVDGEVDATGDGRRVGRKGYGETDGTSFSSTHWTGSLTRGLAGLLFAPGAAHRAAVETGPTPAGPGFQRRAGGRRLIEVLARRPLLKTLVSLVDAHPHGARNLRPPGALLPQAAHPSG
jgi:hypothetical protein